MHLIGDELQWDRAHRNQAHAVYWVWEKMYADIAGQFFQ